MPQRNLFDFAFSKNGGGVQKKPRSPNRQSPTQSSSSSAAQGPSSSSKPAQKPSDRSSPSLAAVAAETRSALPQILPHLPNINASKSEDLHLDYLPPLKTSACPGHTPRAKIKIVNEDSLNAATELAARRPDGGRVAVLNMASDIHAGGGWLKGAIAQEEAMCYRSSLYLSLHKRYYPFKRRGGLYTPDVVVIRGDMASGHKLLVPRVAYGDLPVVSVLSIAAIRRPDVVKRKISTPAGDEEVYEFAKETDRTLTMSKMRLCLRMAASRGHSLLVLGALGCGAFRNPPEEIVKCWLEVLGEAEFGGGWWREVWFAVYDRKNEGNFEVFEDALGGIRV